MQAPSGSGAGAGARAAGLAGMGLVTVGWGCGTPWTREMGVLIHAGHGVLAMVMVYLAVGVQAKCRVSTRGVLTRAVISHPESPLGEHTPYPGLQLLPV